VLTGIDDVLVPPAMQAALADAIPGARRASIAGAGHALTLDRPDESAREVLGFLVDPAAAQRAHALR
jgi:pimeloyl-ACP methyl ester carboxylesterase